MSKSLDVFRHWHNNSNFFAKSAAPANGSNRAGGDDESIGSRRTSFPTAVGGNQQQAQAKLPFRLLEKADSSFPCRFHSHRRYSIRTSEVDSHLSGTEATPRRSSNTKENRSCREIDTPSVIAGNPNSYLKSCPATSTTSTTSPCQHHRTTISKARAVEAVPATMRVAPTATLQLPPQVPSHIAPHPWPRPPPSTLRRMNPNDASAFHNNPNKVSFGYAHHHLDAYPRPDPIQADARSTSDETGMTGMTGDTKQKLFKVVKEQVKMVKSLTNANVAHSAELERVRKENDRLQRQLVKASRGRSRTSSSDGGGRGRGAAPIGSIASASFAGENQPLPPPPPMMTSSSHRHAIDDDVDTIATPYTVDTQLHDYGDSRNNGALPKIQMYDSGLGPKASFPNNASSNRERTNTDPSIDAFSTNVFPSARNVTGSAPPVLKKSRSWNKKRSSRRGGSNGKDQVRTRARRADLDAGPPLPLHAFFVPNFLICKSGPAAKQAWREKIALCIVVFWVSAFFVGLFGFIPLFFCTETDTYTFQDIWAKDREAWTVIHGTIYDMKGLHEDPSRRFRWYCRVAGKG